MVYSYKNRMRHNWERFEEVNAVVADYVRSDGTTISNINVSPIKMLDDPQNIAIPEMWVDRSIFGIDTAALKPSTTQYYPEPNDRIVYADGSEFMVLPLSDQIPCFRYVTTSRERMLVYVKRIKDAS